MARCLYQQPVGWIYFQLQCMLV